FFTVSKRIDIAFQPLKSIQHLIKQRQAIKLHIGTQEVMGRIVFFDRNEINQNETEVVLCQIEVDEAIDAARGDHFIIRRPTPTETIGGGWVIDPTAKKLKFGEQTIAELQTKKTGTPKMILKAILNEKSTLTEEEILNLAAISQEELDEIKPTLLKVGKDQYTSTSKVEQVANKIKLLIEDFHKSFPMRQGINKAEIISELTVDSPFHLVEFALTTLKDNGEIYIHEQYISLSNVTPSLPGEWKKRLENIEVTLIKQDMEVNKWDELLDYSKIPLTIQQDYYYYLLQTKRAFVLDTDRLISKSAVDKAIEKLKNHSKKEDFTLQTAREALNLSRKNLVPFLEL